ncbi:TPA: hypothetical protein ROY14_001449 [Bacillus mobilis]|uniref:MvaI/BcnI family restriction endonuclease n=1 Tax=Bacillus mobilis TaxID=2026190 RepID=UPI0011A47374|nr:MvaI/BcnI family restriction endonuclease [Bacillus mobilis]HDX9639390.1 hypothetical protein [Bacillus mobilis]
MLKEWSIEEITTQLHFISQKGYIGIPDEDFRTDDGVVGQILEKEFGIPENNLRIGDLGVFELKGMRNRKNKSNLTLGHQKPSTGLTTRQLFEKYSYVKASKRNPNILKKKLFTTIKGSRYNNLGLKLEVQDINSNLVNLVHKTDGYLSTWELDLTKVQQMILVFANTEGRANAKDEKFHFIAGTLYQDMANIMSLIEGGHLVMDLCIDQPADLSKPMHDRGPHWRIPVKKLPMLYSQIQTLL